MLLLLAFCYHCVFSLWRNKYDDDDDDDPMCKLHIT